MNYGFLIDNTSCIGCHACSTACKSENSVPIGVSRTWVKNVEVGLYPDVRRSFQVTRCNHCANPPCVRICPTGAMYQRDDGIVEFDTDACIGCKACTQACPYDAIYIDPETHTAAKCHFCSHRTDIGLEPACVVVCPEHAILAGDLDDPTSEISRKLARHNVAVRKPEQGTSPKLFYIEGHEVALHPTVLDREPAMMGAVDVLSLHPGHPVGVHRAGPTAPPAHQPGPEHRRAPQPQGLPEAGPLFVGGRMAEQMVQATYNAQHKIQWHWQIPAYIVTKHIAAGAFGGLALGAFAGVIDGWTVMTAGALGLAMMLVTLVLLIVDLDRPDRFFFLLVRPQWRSWVARAAWILSAFSGVAGLWWAVESVAYFAGFPVPDAVRWAFAAPTLPLAVLASVYTAFLFAQAEGRDLWQSAHVPAQMTLHLVVFGAAVFAVGGPMAAVAQWALIAAVAASAVLTLVADVAVPHASEVARQAARSMVWGAWRQHYWFGGIALGHVLPLLLVTLAAVLGGPVAGVVGVAAMVVLGLGHYLYNLAFVSAPQEIPNS
jgi:Fe-S-cluster-containing dehydrogenase component/formate-dependent nitrite reductase membrane component NrfD